MSDADIARLLEPVALLDEKIEEQIGCRIVEVGEVIPVPDGAPQGWNEDEQRYRRTCPVLADEGQILGFTMDDENHGSPEAQGQANSSGGTFSYLRPVLEIWPCPGCEVDALTACGGTRVSAEAGQSSRQHHIILGARRPADKAREGGAPTGRTGPRVFRPKRHAERSEAEWFSRDGSPVERRVGFTTGCLTSDVIPRPRP